MTKDQTPTALGAIDHETERAKFEALIAKECGDLSTFGTGQNLHYRNSAVNNAWIGWSARAALAPAAPAPAPAPAPDTAARSIAELLTLVGDYWDIAYQEGQRGATHDTEDAAAGRKWNEIRTAAAKLAALAPARASVPQPVWADQVRAIWADAYAAFVGAFDTPQQRRVMADEYSTDARTRLRAFDFAIKAPIPVPHASVDQAEPRDLVVDQAEKSSGECHAAADGGLLACVTCGAPAESARDRELLAWAYSKLVYRSFADMDDCLAMDEIKLILMGAQ